MSGRQYLQTAEKFSHNSFLVYVKIPWFSREERKRCCAVLLHSVVLLDPLSEETQFVDKFLQFQCNYLIGKKVKYLGAEFLSEI